MARKDKPEELNEIRAAVQELVRRGLVVDSGERRCSERTLNVLNAMKLYGHWRVLAKRCTEIGHNERLGRPVRYRSCGRSGPEVLRTRVL